MGKYWTKPRIVFLVWAVAELIGWLTTHYIFMNPTANWVWLILSIIAFIPMFRYMPWKQKKLRSILLLWLATVTVGMVVSFLAFQVDWARPLAAYLGVFWLLLMGAAFFVNALWWTPRLFVLGGAIQIVAGIIPLLVQNLLYYQYLIAAIAGTAGMLVLLPNSRSALLSLNRRHQPPVSRPAAHQGAQ